jgi:hypothetical protein
MYYIPGDADTGRRLACRRGDRPAKGRGLKAMTMELIYLTAQIQRWLNRRIARHLAEQAERLAR